MKLRLLIVIAFLGSGPFPGAGWGTSVFMEELPTFSRFRCLICHDVQDPAAGEATLNAFGADFRDNGMRWDENLALENSDGDNCTNGFELSDEDGDGQPDSNRTEERKNPGEKGDCTLQLNEETWSRLKQLFRQ
ncbi:MAG: hypothetical protein ACE5G2_11770 [Candidatus Krumholzibacteriia bacterium]